MTDRQFTLEDALRLAMQQQQAGSLQQADQICRQILQQIPEHPDALYILATLAEQGGRLDEALDLYARAVSKRPAHVDYRLRLAALQRRCERLDEAWHGLREAARLSPERSDVLLQLAGVEQDLERYPDSERHYREVLDREPGHAGALHGLATACAEQGRLSDAISYHQRAVALAPSFTRAHYSLALLKRYTERDDPQLQAMETLLAGQDLAPAARADLHFALGKAYDDLDDAATAFTHWSQGNRLLRGTFRYDLRGDEAMFTAMRQRFDRSLLAAAGDGLPDETPVFIVGMPRSGTSLVEQILAAHPRVCAAGERPDLKLLLLGAARARVPGEFVAQLAGLDAAVLQQLAARYLSGLRARDSRALRITDKMPTNFMWLGMVQRMFPNARIVHCRREPVATCLSCFRQQFSGSHLYAYELAELGGYYRLYEGLMAHWHAVLPAGRILDVQYEELVADQEGQTRRLLEYCGLEWDAACLAPHRAQRAVKTASVAQVRQPLYTGSLQKWRRYEAHLGPLLAALGELAPVGDDPQGAAQ